MASIAAAGLEVHEAGRALRVQTETPHLVSMGSGRLSTAVTLHPLPEGRYKCDMTGYFVFFLLTKYSSFTLDLKLSTYCYYPL